MPQNSRWQYPAKVDPLRPIVAETVTVDKWFQYSPMPVRRPPFIASHQSIAFIEKPTPLIQISSTTAQVLRPKIVQYQSVAWNPFTPASTVTTIDWLVQHPIAPPRRRTPEGSQVGDFTPIIPSFGYNVAQPDVVRRKFFLQQGGSAFTDPQIVSYSWHVPQSDLVRRKFIMREGGLSWSTFTPTTIFFDWYQPPAEILRRKFFLNEGGSSFVDDPKVSFGWHVSQSDLVRRKFLMREGGETFIDTPRVAPLDWQVQKSDVIRRKVFINEGGETFVDTPRVSFSWQINQPDVVRRKVSRIEGGTSFVDDKRVIFDWLVPQSDLIRRKHQLREGESVGGFTPIIPSFGYNVPQSDLIRRKKFINEGGETFVDTPRVSFSWDVPQSDLVRRKLQVQEGMFTSGEPVEVHVDWIQQHPTPPQRPPQKRLSAVTEILRPPDVFADSWYQQYPDQTRTRKCRPDIPSHFWSTFTPAEIVTLDKWWQQQFNPFIKPKRPPTNVVYPIRFITELTPPIFTIRDCLLLEEIFENSLLPLPSGFTSYQTLRVASGYVAPSEALPAPSGWVKTGDATPWNLAR